MMPRRPPVSIANLNQDPSSPMARARRDSSRRGSSATSPAAGVGSSSNRWSRRLSSTSSVSSGSSYAMPSNTSSSSSVRPHLPAPKWKVTHASTNEADCSHTAANLASPETLNRNRSSGALSNPRRSSFADAKRLEVQKAAQRNEANLRFEEQLSKMEKECTAEGITKNDRTFMALCLVGEARRFQKLQERSAMSTDLKVMTPMMSAVARAAVEARRASANQRTYSLLNPTAYKAVIDDVRILMKRQAPQPKKDESAAIDEVASPTSKFHIKPPADNFTHIKRELSGLNLWTTHGSRRRPQAAVSGPAPSRSGSSKNVKK